MAGSRSTKLSRCSIGRGSLPPSEARISTLLRNEVGMSRAREWRMRPDRRALAAALFTFVSSFSLGQQASPNPPQPKDKRIFWIIPNYRTSPSLHPYKPLFE